MSPDAATTPKKIKFQNQTSVNFVALKQLPHTQPTPLRRCQAPRCLGCAAAAPATTARRISRRGRRNSGIRRHQLGAAVLGYHSPGSNPPAAPISGRNLHASHYPALPTQHPAHPSAQPARAGVRSESPNPAERTNKKTAGSHGTGDLDDRPHLLRRQVSSPAPPPSPQHFAARALTPAPACPHGQPPTAYLPLPPPLP
jgi:hypothetical protein